MKSERVSLLALFIWVLALVFFFYEFFLRILLGTIASDVIFQLDLSAGQFSTIAGAYYVTYGLMQVPVGMLTEKVGARLTLSAACLFCASGVFLFSVSHGYVLALISRLFIGFGSSFAFVSLMLLSLKWFPRKYFSVMTGLALFLGATGPVLAGAPLAKLYEAMDGNWRAILIWLGVFGVALAIALLFFIRNEPKESEKRIIFLSLSKEDNLNSFLKTIFSNKQCWMVFIYTATTYVILPLFAAYWGTLYLQARDIELTNAAFIISMEWVGYAVGSPILGKLSDYTKRRKPYLCIPMVIGVIASSLILFLPTTSETLLASFFFFIGFAVSGQSLSFSAIIEQTPRALHSTALGVNNAVSMLSAAVLPVFVGVVIQKHQIGPKIQQAALMQGLSITPVLFCVAFLVAFFGIKETFCRQQHEVHTLHKFSEFL